MTADDAHLPAPVPAPAPAPSTAGAPTATLLAASMNLLNLALPGQVFYDNQDAYSEAEYSRKTEWIGQQVRRLGADLVAVQEVWHRDALQRAIAASGLRYAQVLAPGAEAGAVGTPRVGLVTRLPLEDVRSIADFPAGHAVEVPEIGRHDRFERPVLHARLRAGPGGPMHVLVVHLKSKRPKFRQDDAGNPLEDRDDPRVQARAALRSLLMRGAEAAALRALVVSLLEHTREPLLLLGDLNDGPRSVTTQIIANTHAVAWDRGALDTALFHAVDVQTGAMLPRDLGYSHVHQGVPDVLDQIWVSEEWVALSKFSRGEVLRVEYFNDHLNEGRDRTRSDHGFVRALLRWRAG